MAGRGVCLSSLQPHRAHNTHAQQAPHHHPPKLMLWATTTTTPTHQLKKTHPHKQDSLLSRKDDAGGRVGRREQATFGATERIEREEEEEGACYGC